MNFCERERVKEGERELERERERERKRESTTDFCREEDVNVKIESLTLFHFITIQPNTC